MYTERLAGLLINIQLVQIVQKQSCHWCDSYCKRYTWQTSRPLSSLQCYKTSDVRVGGYFPTLYKILSQNCSLKAFCMKQTGFFFFFCPRFSSPQVRLKGEAQKSIHDVALWEIACNLLQGQLMKMTHHRPTFTCQLILDFFFQHTCKK